MAKPVLFGVDKLQQDNFSVLKGARVALLANASTVDSKLCHLVDSLRATSVCKLVKLFAPEHGFFGAMQDMEAVDEEDSKEDIPIVSLYGDTPESLVPSASDFEDIDLLLIDLPDIGARYYTYAQTMIYCMQIAVKVGVKVVVLDRPNPINGADFEGSGLQASCRSFCGHLETPNRHGLTLGELAEMANQGFGEGESAQLPIDCELEIIKVSNWKREMFFEQTDFPWVLPSPNMPTLETAVVYPGACLFEATNVSEGRGTTRPFELIGAPFISPERWIRELKQHSELVRGIQFRSVSFSPRFQKWSGEICHGVQLHVSDRRAFKPYRCGLLMILTLNQLYPEDFAWRKGSYEFIDNVPAIDLLYGSSGFREVAETKRSFDSLLIEIEEFENWYSNARKNFLLY